MRPDRSPVTPVIEPAPYEINRRAARYLPAYLERCACESCEEARAVALRWYWEGR